MKTTKIMIALVAIATAMVSCGFGKSATTSSTPATGTAQQTTAAAVQMGKNAGSSLDMLTAQYKTDGKLDMSNLSNIANMLNLAAASQQLYANKSNSDYRKGFVNGMILNSINIDELNATTVTEALDELAEQTNIDALQEAAQKGEATAEEVKKTADSVTQIIEIFKK